MMYKEVALGVCIIIIFILFCLVIELMNMVGG